MTTPDRAVLVRRLVVMTGLALGAYPFGALLGWLIPDPLLALPLMALYALAVVVTALWGTDA